MALMKLARCSGVQAFDDFFAGLATYVSVEPVHLFRYLVQQAFRYNHRKDDDGSPLTDFARFDAAVRQIVGKRLTFDQLTGKAMDSQA